jgi:hypothetical protein
MSCPNVTPNLRHYPTFFVIARHQALTLWEFHEHGMALDHLAVKIRIAFLVVNTVQRGQKRFTLGKW